MHQIEMVTLEGLVPLDPIYRKVSGYFPQEIITSHLATKYETTYAFEAYEDGRDLSSEMDHSPQAYVESTASRMSKVGRFMSKPFKASWRKLRGKKKGAPVAAV